MKGFALDSNGDLLIENNEISLVVGDSLLQQKVQTVLRTNLREWFSIGSRGLILTTCSEKTRMRSLCAMKLNAGLHR